MTFFSPDARNRSAWHRQVYAAYELWYTAVDFGAAACFIAGSILFFSEATQWVGTWLFLSGSILFAGKPTIRLLRELQYLRRGRTDCLAKRAENQG
jgi:hypothetical protein